MDKTVHKIPFLRFVLALSTGILTGSFIHLNYPVLIASLIILTGLLFGINFFYNYNLSVYFGVGVHLFFIGTGNLLYHNYNHKPEFFKNGKFIASVQEIIQEKQGSYQSVLKIHGFIKKDSIIQTDEQVVVWFEKNDESKTLKPGQMIIFNHSPIPIKNNNNPYEFDYKKYLSRKKIFRQIYIPSGSWVQTGQLPFFSLSVTAEKLRLYFLDIYAQQNWSERELDVISALVLGYKKGLDPETKRIFTKAGAMHVLAVSGLHVGILFLLLSWIFGFLNQHGFGKIIFIFLILLLLWGFAFITGLSPSVNRAATMFTFIIIGWNIRRQVNIYNTLAASAFFLLLFNPNNLFDAGFQLSYIAVFGIVFLQPKFENLLHFRFKLTRHMWSLFTVSFAAQIATFPLVVYYFHQFPVYFWISSMVVLPAVTLLIPLGIAILVLHWMPFVVEMISGTAGFILTFLIEFLEWIEKWPCSIINFHFSGLELTFSIAILISFFFFLQFQQVRYFKSILIFFLLFLVTSLGAQIPGLFRSEIIVYNYDGQYVVHFVTGKKNYIISEKELKQTDSIHSLIDNTVHGLQIKPPVYLLCNNYYNDSFLYLNNGFIGLDGKVIYFHTRSRQTEGPFVPDIIIGAAFKGNTNSETSPLQIMLSDKEQHSNLYCLKEKGAFRLRW